MTPVMRAGMCQGITHGKDASLAEPKQKQLLRINGIGGKDFIDKMIDRLQGSQYLLRLRFADHSHSIPFVGAGSQQERCAWADPEQSLGQMRSQPDQVFFVAAASVQGEDCWIAVAPRAGADAGNSIR